VKSDERRLKARQYVEQLASAGRYVFTGREAQAPLGVSAKAAALALNRLAKRGLLASPARGLYVIVPPEYRSLGCLPVLSELGEKIDPAKLVAAANAAPIAWAQRLGYLLEQVGSAAKTGPLQEHVRVHVRNTTALTPGRAFKNSPRDSKWKVYVNAGVETDV